MNIDQINKLCNEQLPELDNYALLRIISTALLTVSGRIVGDDFLHNEMIADEFDNHTDTLIPPTEMVKMSVACWYYANSR